MLQIGQILQIIRRETKRPHHHEHRYFAADFGAPEPFAPPEQELARAAGERLRRLLQEDTGAGVSLELHFRRGADAASEVVALPPSALPLLEAILEAGGRGQMAAGVSGRAELSPTQAAALLGVSRPFVNKLLDEGRIPFRRVGTHRRIAAPALENYRRAEEARALEVMATLQAQAQELGMGYEGR